MRVLDVSGSYTIEEIETYGGIENVKKFERLSQTSILLDEKKWHEEYHKLTKTQKVIMSAWSSRGLER